MSYKPILLEKAAEFHRMIYGETSKNFQASQGFQWTFCKRFVIKNLAICGEKLSSYTIDADEFIKEFFSISSIYTIHQLFNCNETGLYYKMPPGHTLVTVD